MVVILTSFARELHCDLVDKSTQTEANFQNLHMLEIRFVKIEGVKRIQNKMQMQQVEKNIASV